ncbi:MAG TPA: hypothetical protein VM286_08700 [Candidatus Thermoplasmatota archaeon]|nr:hypothetical protein [Candidatus Thermoplasmatota archaeon]
MPEDRWLVSVRTRSSVRLANNEPLMLSTHGKGGIDGFKIRNTHGLDLQGRPVVVDLVCEGVGQFETMEKAVEVLSWHAFRFFPLIALAANATVDEAMDLEAYKLPHNESELAPFYIRRHSHPREPNVAVRDLRWQDLAALIGAVNSHPREDRLERAVGHYQLALSFLDGTGYVLAAEHLYIAVENLTQVIVERLARAAGIKDEKPTTLLAKQAGLGVRQFQNKVRIEHIFEGDFACFDSLVEASDKLEHGYGSFYEVRERATRAAMPAFVFIRRAILRELGIAAESNLLSGAYSTPVPAWRPNVELFGRVGGSGLPTSEAFSKNVAETWPWVQTPHVDALILNVSDGPAGRTGELRVDIRDDRHALYFDKSYWHVPAGNSPQSNWKAVYIQNGTDISSFFQPLPKPSGQTSAKTPS